MKRCIKKVIDWIRKNSWKENISFGISAILSIVMSVSIFVDIDTIPATLSDYEQLENQINAIQQNPDLLLETDCNIIVKDDKITVEIENDNCKMTAKYDKNNFKVLETSKEDKYAFWLWAIIFALFTFIVMCAAGCAVILFVIEIIQFVCSKIITLIKWICRKISKIKEQ